MTTVSEEFNGTCRNPNEEELDAIIREGEIELCSRCGWWEEDGYIDTIGDEMVCHDCIEEGEVCDD